MGFTLQVRAPGGVLWHAFAAAGFGRWHTWTPAPAAMSTPGSSRALVGRRPLGSLCASAGSTPTAARLVWTARGRGAHHLPLPRACSGSRRSLWRGGAKYMRYVLPVVDRGKTIAEPFLAEARRPRRAALALARARPVRASARTRRVQSTPSTDAGALLTAGGDATDVVDEHDEDVDALSETCRGRRLIAARVGRCGRAPSVPPATRRRRARHARRAQRRGDRGPVGPRGGFTDVHDLGPRRPAPGGSPGCSAPPPRCSPAAARAHPAARPPVRLRPARLGHRRDARACLRLLLAHAALILAGYTIGDRISLWAEVAR